MHVAGRGGQFTYHGPGQRVAYVMLDLRRRGQDVRRFVAALEQWIILTLAGFNVTGERREDRVGVWVRRPDKGPGHEDKIAAIGIRIRHWVSLHGIALNVDPELGHFAGIVPCGIADPRYGVTSLVDLGIPVTMPEVDGRHACRLRGGVRTHVLDDGRHRDLNAGAPLHISSLYISFTWRRYRSKRLSLHGPTWRPRGRSSPSDKRPIMNKNLLLKLHRWITLIFALPLAVVVITGLVLSVEPMIATGPGPVAVTADGLTAVLAKHDPGNQAARSSSAAMPAISPSAAPAAAP